MRSAVIDANLDAEKRVAAEAAAELVEDGMTVGLGTGSTVAHLLPALAARGLEDLRCVATSVATEEQARELGIAGGGRSTRSTGSTSRSTAPTRSTRTAGWSRAAAAPTPARRSSPRRPSASS